MTNIEKIDSFCKSLEAYIEKCLSSGEKHISRQKVNKKLKDCPKALHTTVIQMALYKFKDSCNGMSINKDGFTFWS